MPYYKDTLNGKFPLFSAVELDDARFTEISEAEWDGLRQAGSTEDHPYSPYVQNREAMAEATRDHLPPEGIRLPDPPAPEHPLPEGPIQGIIHEEAR
ncbi:hypothetical protein J7643_03760 [bacterium]|nr:hypothetical protein [bacterium]